MEEMDVPDSPRKGTVRSIEEKEVYRANGFQIAFTLRPRALVGANWDNSSNCGSRAVKLNNLSARANSNNAGRGAGETGETPNAHWLIHSSTPSLTATRNGTKGRLVGQPNVFHFGTSEDTMKRLGNVFDKIASIENLNLALDKAARHKKRRPSTARTLANRDGQLDHLHSLLVNGKYKTSMYHSKVLFEPKMRTIYSLPFYPDRIVHHAVMNVLEPFWDARLIFDSYACRKGKGLHKGSTRCMEFVRKYKYCLQCDVHRFYQSVDHVILKKMVRQKIKDPRLLELLDEVIDSANSIPHSIHGRNVPIGNLLSQWFGNMYMGEFDTWVKQEKRIKAYVRYCDDFLFFADTKDELNALRTEAIAFLADRLKLTLSKANLFPVEQGIDFLGYRHFPDYILVRKRTAKKIKRFARDFHAGKYASDMVHAMGVAASYHGLMKHAQTYNLRKSIDFPKILKQVGIDV